jgi:hypothetical protein
MVLFERAQPGALTRRLRDVSDLSRYGAKPLELGAKLAARYAANLDPVALVARGDPLPRHHVARGGGSVLAASLLLAAVGVSEALRRRDRWSVFVLCGAALSLVPASVTTDTLHTLRMAPFLVFLLVLSIPAFQALAARPTVLWAVLLGGLAQDLGNGYVHAYWYGALRGISRDAYAWLPPGQAPPGSLILSDREVPGLTVVSRHGTYFGYLTAPRRAP